jgi:DinB superfamily
MAVFSKQGLITELLDRTELIKASTQGFLRLTNEQLNFKPVAGQWSIAGNFEHLNICNGAYVRSILTRISGAPDIKADKYNSGWLGDWVYSKIMPRPDGSVFKMRTGKLTRPATGVLDGQDILHRHLQNCDMIDDIVRHAATKDLQRIKIPFSVLQVLKLRLGDSLRYLIAHNERHLLQAHRMVGIIPAALA